MKLGSDVFIEYIYFFFSVCSNEISRGSYVYMIVVDPLFQVIRGHYTPLNEVVLEELNLPGLTELRGSWHGSLDASGGGNGDTMVYIFPILARVQISNIFFLNTKIARRWVIIFWTTGCWDKNDSESYPMKFCCPIL